MVPLEVEKYYTAKSGRVRQVTAVDGDKIEYLTPGRAKDSPLTCSREEFEQWLDAPRGQEAP